MENSNNARIQSILKSPNELGNDMVTIPEVHDDAEEAKRSSGPDVMSGSTAVKMPAALPSAEAPTTPDTAMPPGDSKAAGRRRSIIKDPGAKPGLRKKTVSFSRLPSEAAVKNSADCISLMQAGHQFVKMRSNSRVYNRLYWLDESLSCLRWEPSKKDSGKARIDITGIREVRPGKTTDLFLSSDISLHFPDECSFSIVHGDGKTLDLIANSADDANVWITGLRCLMSGQDMEGLRLRADARDTWLSKMFDGADINGDGYLDEEESLELLTTLSDGIREFRIKQKLQEHVQMKERGDRLLLSRLEFIEIFKDVATRPEIYFLLARFASRDDRLSVDDLSLFLESEQGITGVTYEACVSLIERFEPSETLKKIPALGIDGFTKYLMSAECEIFDPAHTQVCQDMTQPLSHYFIASSHNTYLMEDQLAGPSEVDAYERALLRCCRSVELDCWDGPDGAPVVTHGHTATNSIIFRDVIETVKTHAFTNSDYPVILTIENHCCEEQQRIMAQDLVDILGDRIYREELPDRSALLPSPAALTGRVLIRSQKLPPGCTKESDSVSDVDEGEEVRDVIVNSPIANAKPLRLPEKTNRKPTLVKELSDLVSVCVTVRLTEDLDAHRRHYKPCHTSSIHERTAIELVDNSPDAFTIHNKRYLTRVYPSGARCDSSNFNPQDYWNCGVQIVALNYQTPGLMMDINDGRFSMNGGCGYVLKPFVMRDPYAFYNPNQNEGSDAIPGETTKILTLRIISGQNFPKPRGGGAKGHVIDPYVLIELFGVSADCSEQRTRTAPNNSGESPLFDESFEFRLTLPSLALVRFVVLDDEFIGDEFIGQYTIPFECIRPGYRHLRLRSIFDEPLKDASLFVHISVTETEPVVVSLSGAIVSSQPVPSGGGTLKKRATMQKRLKKARSRKDIDVLPIRDVGVSQIDDVFREADVTLRNAVVLRDAQRWSLTYLREACGAPHMASIKQCIRTLGRKARMDSNASDGMRPTRAWSAVTEGELQTNDSGDAMAFEQRRRTVSADLVTSRLRRQPSETSQSSNDSSASQHSVALLRQERRLLLELRGLFAASEFWRKASSAVDAFVSDTLAILDDAPGCVESLMSVCKKAESMYKNIGKLLGIRGTAGGHDVSEVAVANGVTHSKKAGKSSSKKKTLPYSYGELRKRQAVEENFRWNYSVVKGQIDLLRGYHKNANRHLNDLWLAGVQFGLAQDQDRAKVGPEARPVNGVANSPDHDGNQNGNNNGRDVTNYSRNGTKSLFSVAKHSFSPFQRSKSAPSGAKQSLTSDLPKPVTPL